MAGKTNIEWADAVWNPVVGCSVVSAGCTNCYAMRQAARWRNQEASVYHGLTRPRPGKGPVWTGDVRLAPMHTLLAPLHWKKPRRIFVNSMGDLFHESVPDEWIDQVFAVMALAPQHLFMVLTKRPERMRKYLKPHCQRRADGLGRFVLKYGYQGPLEALRWPVPNVWLGVSVEDQATADNRIPDLLEAPAAGRFLSCEPLLGAIDLSSAWHGESALQAECWGECGWCENGRPGLHNCHKGKQSSDDYRKGRSGLDLVIVGGESGPGARPMHPHWARDLQNQCQMEGTLFNFKQWGDWLPFFEKPIEPIDDDAEISRFQWCVWNPAKSEWEQLNGCWDDYMTSVIADDYWEAEQQMWRVGAKKAGRFLYFSSYNDLPPLPGEQAL